MKRCLCIIDSLGPGGAQRQLVGLATFLNEKGYDVAVVTYHNNDFYLDKLESNGVTYIYLSKAERMVWRIWCIARLVHQTKPDVVVAYLETPSICACLTKMFIKRFKLIVSERNTTQRNGLREKVRFNLFRLADYVVPNSFSQEAFIVSRFPFLSNKTETIPNFVDLDYFTPSYKRRRIVPEIVVVASIWESKNTLGLIDAVNMLREKGIPFRISWFGKSESNIGYFNLCQKRIEQLGLEDYISLKDKTSQIKTVYQNADFFCLPSFYEGTPNVICEAMASGLPIVCSEVCDNPKYVIHNVNGFLFDPHDTSSISSAIEELLSISSQQYEAFCKKSRELAEQYLSKERFIQSYIQLIES